MNQTVTVIRSRTPIMEWHFVASVHRFEFPGIRQCQSKRSDPDRRNRQVGFPNVEEFAMGRENDSGWHRADDGDERGVLPVP